MAIQGFDILREMHKTFITKWLSWSFQGLYSHALDIYLYTYIYSKQYPTAHSRPKFHFLPWKRTAKTSL